MLEFKVLQELKPNSELLGVLKNYTHKTKIGKVKHLLHTNLQIIEPTEYVITSPITLTILEYKINEISSKPFYIKEYHKKYNLKELIKLLKNWNLRVVKLIFCEETYERNILI